MTVEQVFKYLKRKAKAGDAYMLQTLNELNKFKDKGYYFNVIGSDMYAMKKDEKPYRFCFESLQYAIELEGLR